MTDINVKKIIEFTPNEDYELYVCNGEWVWQRIEGSQKPLSYWDKAKMGMTISFVATRKKPLT